ncbi:MAG: DUF1570 domain-containing protein [Planctomycetes bacterium]|nr:DUF1570 domain-containing protein [Planctomycetota bacterium]
MNRATLLCLSALLATGWAAAEPELKEVRTKHYTVRSDLKGQELRELQHFLEAMFKSYSKTFKGEPLREGYAPQVRVFREQADYTAFGQSDSGVRFNANWRGYFSRSRTELVSYRGETLADLFAILSHEGLHQFMWGYGVPPEAEDFPDWFEEGLGEWFRTGRTRGSTLIQSTLTYHVERVRRAIDEGWVWTLDQILECDPAKLEDPDRFNAFYAHAYLLMDLLCAREPAVVRQIYLQKKAGKTNAEIMAEVLGTPEKKERLYQAFLQHVKTKK